jgi:hypothetical protein
MRRQGKGVETGEAQVDNLCYVGMEEGHRLKTCATWASVITSA